MRFTSLRTLQTGHVFSRSTPDFFSRWNYIVDAVCHEFGCNEDDLDLIEDDEGSLVTLKGEPVVRIEHGYAVNVMRPLMQEAAE